MLNTNLQTSACKGRALRRVRWSLAILLFLSVPILGQVITATLSGIITDPTGAVIPNAELVITNTSTNVNSTSVTNDTGAYLFTALPPGTYRVRVTAKGFQTTVRENVVLAVSQSMRGDLTLRAGNVNQTVLITSAVPLLDATSAVSNTTLTGDMIADLPLNGGNFENLVQQAPGVERYPGGGFGTLSTDGLRTEDNIFTVDGVASRDPFTGQSIVNGAPLVGDTTSILPVEAIQDFAVEQNPTAEYGWEPGAIVNVGLKSGGNQIHGMAYGEGRDTPWDARNYFNAVGTQKTPVEVEQFGGAAGGPILKDKLFWFVNYEGQKYTVGNSYTLSSPATVSLAGPSTGCSFTTSGNCSISIPDATADLNAGHIPVSPLSLTLAKLYPANDGTNPGGPGTITNGFPNVFDSENGIAKMDYHLDPKNTLTGMYFIGNLNGTAEDAPYLEQEFDSTFQTKAYVGEGDWTWIATNNVVNQARFSYSRLVQTTLPGGVDQPSTDFGINTGVTNPLYGGLPTIYVSTFSSLGPGPWPKIQGPDQVYEGTDNLSYVHGSHNLNFGTDIMRNMFHGGAYGEGKGRIHFGSTHAFTGATPLEDFLAGVPAFAQVLVGDPTRNLSELWFSFFATDAWRLTRRLTLNYGLRYEYATVLKEANNLLGGFDPNIGLEQVGKQISAPYSSDPRDIAPRFGITWDVNGKGTTVLRGSVGLYFEQVSWEPFMALNNAFGIGNVPTGAAGVTPGGGTINTGNIVVPGSQLNWTPAGPVYPSAASLNVSCSSAVPCGILTINPAFHTPYVSEWNLGIQHSLSNNFAVDVSYVGNTGTDLLSTADSNQINPQSPAEIACGHCEANGDRPYGANYPYLSYIYLVSNNYASNYNALVGTLKARDLHGMNFIASYAWSHSLNDVLANWGSETLPQNSDAPARAEWGPSDEDIRQRFVLSFTYNIPGPKGFGHLGLQGWSINSIVTLQSRMPWGATDASDDISATGEYNDRWDFFGNPSDFNSGPTSIPYFPGTSNPSCVAHASTAGMLSSLGQFGCYAKGQSVMLPPAIGTFGTMSRNLFRDSGFSDWDFSVTKKFQIKERYGAVLHADFFNLLNHPNFANPGGGSNGFNQNDPSAPGTFGCGCATPDVAGSDPVFGSGGPRESQIGLKVTF